MPVTNGSAPNGSKKVDKRYAKVFWNRMKFATAQNSGPERVPGRRYELRYTSRSINGSVRYARVTSSRCSRLSLDKKISETSIKMK